MNNVAVCIGCGCDDDHACEVGCYWARVDYDQGKGVCSECPDYLAAWDEKAAGKPAETINRQKLVNAQISLNRAVYLMNAQNNGPLHQYTTLSEEELSDDKVVEHIRDAIRNLEECLQVQS